MDNILVLDIGGTSIKYALMNKEDNLISKGKLEIERESLDRLTNDVVSIASQFEGQYEGVAISMPGRINTKAGIAHSGGVFQFLIDVPFANIISDMLGGKRVVIANDANCACKAELEYGALKGCNGGAVLVLGSSIGGAIAINGKVWEGAHYAAGEPAWLPLSLVDFCNLQFNNKRCTKGLASSINSTTGLLNEYDMLKGCEPRNSANGGDEFFENLRMRESEAQEAFDKFTKTMAAEIFSIQAMLDLEVFAIGGGISNEEEVVSSIRLETEEMYKKNPHSPVKLPRIEKCKFGNEANLIGAYKYY